MIRVASRHNDTCTETVVSNLSRTGTDSIPPACFEETAATSDLHTLGRRIFKGRAVVATLNTAISLISQFLIDVLAVHNLRRRSSGVRFLLGDAVLRLRRPAAPLEETACNL